MTKFLALLLALFRALPALRELAGKLDVWIAKLREARALVRKQQKDKAVDDAIDNP